MIQGRIMTMRMGLIDMAICRVLDLNTKGWICGGGGVEVIQNIRNGTYPIDVFVQLYLHLIVGKMRCEEYE